MKRIIPLIVSMLLLLTSCSIVGIPGIDNSTESMRDDHMDNKQKDYSAIILSGVESGVFKDSFILPEYESKEEIIDDTHKSTFGLGVREIDAYKSKIIYTNRAIIDEYRSENEKFLYQIDRTSNSFSIQAKDNSVLQEYSFEELTGATLLEQIKNYIKYYLPDENFENYNTFCNTRIIVNNPDSAWGENKDFFYQANKGANETVLYYEYEFRIFNQNLRTPDSITIRCDGDGNITSMRYNNYGINWDSVFVDLNSIHQKAKAFVSSAISEEYSLISCSIESESFDYVDSRIRVMVVCELTLTRDGSDNIEVLCPVLITP